MVLVHQEPPRRWEADDIIVTDPPVIRRAIGAAAIGNTTEWYDFGVYAFFEPTIQKVFFSDLDHTTGLIATFALFAVAFLVRPFGGLLFGPLADRIGRNKVLATTMILMALGTFAIGCIPSPQSIGLWAPVLLLCARLVQGFSTGGEYGNAMTFIAEYAPDRHRGFLGSCLEFGTYVGYLMGAAAVTLTGFLFTDEQMLDWGWRVPFFVALPLGLVGVYMRAKLADTPAFEQMEAESEAREKELRTRHTARDLLALWPFVLVCMGLVITWNVTAYMLTSYVPTYVSSTLPHATGGGISPRTSELLQIAIMAIAMVTIPLVGRYSDRIGRKPLLVAGSVIISVGAFPMFLLMQADSVGSVFAGAAAHDRRRGVLQRRDALDPAVAVPDAPARRRPVDLVQHRGLAVRRHDVADLGLVGGGDGQPQRPGLLHDLRRGHRPHQRLAALGAQRPPHVGVGPGRRRPRGGPRDRRAPARTGVRGPTLRDRAADTRDRYTSHPRPCARPRRCVGASHTGATHRLPVRAATPVTEDKSPARRRRTGDLVVPVSLTARRP
ncbi:MFS transporter [Piscicoccus intestinalis]|uniref:MFS transporter n=1 Tax=Piscicoccus intestinalis TaxID=746033 RepID=UPI000AD2EA2E|nr:MFS transporter [Piscicoccus intestinalis]